MPARDLDDADTWLVQRMADDGQTIGDVAKAFWITEDQVRRYLCEDRRRRLAERFEETQAKKEGRSVPPTRPLGFLPEE